jgi:hypothetical protein
MKNNVIYLSEIDTQDYSKEKRDHIDTVIDYCVGHKVGDNWEWNTEELIMQRLNDLIDETTEKTVIDIVKHEFNLTNKRTKRKKAA